VLSTTWHGQGRPADFFGVTSKSHVRVSASENDSVSLLSNGSFSRLLEIVRRGRRRNFCHDLILIRLSQREQKLVMDMAPIGHALELLRMPERILAWPRPLLKTLATHRTLALARDAAVQSILALTSIWSAILQRKSLAKALCSLTTELWQLA